MNKKLLLLQKALREKFFFIEAGQINNMLRKESQEGQQTNSMGQTTEQASAAARRNLDEAISGFMVTINGITGGPDATQQLLAHIQQATDGPIFNAVMKAVASQSDSESLKKEALPDGVGASARNAAWVAKIVANSAKLKQQGEAVYSALTELLSQKYPNQKGGQTTDYINVAKDEINKAINRNSSVPKEAGAIIKAMIQRFMS